VALAQWEQQTFEWLIAGLFRYIKGIVKGKNHALVVPNAVASVVILSRPKLDRVSKPHLRLAEIIVLVEVEDSEDFVVEETQKFSEWLVVEEEHKEDSEDFVVNLVVEEKYQFLKVFLPIVVEEKRLPKVLESEDSEDPLYHPVLESEDSEDLLYHPVLCTYLVILVGMKDQKVALEQALFPEYQLDLDRVDHKVALVALEQALFPEYQLGLDRVDQTLVEQVVFASPSCSKKFVVEDPVQIVVELYLTGLDS